MTRPLSFSAWLRKQTLRSDDVGVLARNLREDRCLPRGGGAYRPRVIAEHRRTQHNADPAEIEALCLAIGEHALTA